MKVWLVLCLGLIALVQAAPIRRDAQFELEHIEEKVATLEKLLQGLEDDLDERDELVQLPVGQTDVLPQKQSVALPARNTEDQDLEEFKAKLPQKDQDLINKFKSKLELLKDAIQHDKEKGGKPNPEDVEIVQSHEPKPKERRRENSKVKDFISHLSAQDQEMLSRMKSKIHYIEDALNRPEHNEEEVATKARRGENSKLQDYISHLKPEDQQLLQKMKSKVHFLEEALERPPTKDKDEETDAVNDRRELMGLMMTDEQQREKLNDFISHLSPEDAELLQRVKSKIGYLKDALNRPSKPEEEEDVLAQQPEQQPEVKMTERCDCDKELDPRCNCDKDKDKNGLQRKRLDDIEAILKDDIEYARKNGLPIKRILDDIKHEQDTEAELEGLRQL